MPAQTVDINLNLELPSILEGLITLHRAGEDVRRNIADCLLMANEIECRVLADALALMTLARILYGYALDYAVRQHTGTVELMLEADKFMDRATAFMEQESGAKLPKTEDRRRKMN